MKKLFVLLLTLILAVLPAAAQTMEFNLENQSAIACQALLTGDYALVISMLNDTAAAQLSEELLAQTMTALASQYGQLTAVSDVEYYAEQRAAVYVLDFAGGRLDLAMVFDADGKLAALTLTPGSAPEVIERNLPEGAAQTPVTLWPDSDRALNGMLIAPANANETTPYVIFIHGSGASDMDETMGPNKIFRDMAYDLAALGIGSLRFDKITYSHPELFTGTVTVTEEYLEPAKEAMRTLKENTLSENIYVIGHSLGGMLTPWLVQECGFAGGVALAGTPLPLWQMSYDQNLLIIETVPEDQRAALLAQVNAERERALTIPDMSDDEAAAATIFGMNALYLKSIDVLDEIAIAEDSGKPFLFIWGDQDVQVSRAAFEAWQTNLPADGPYAYIVYEGLNHMFLPAEDGDSISNIQAAYSRPGLVPEYVASNIAEWITEDLL